MTSKYEYWKNLDVDAPLYGLMIDEDGPLFEECENKAENIFRLFVEVDEAEAYAKLIVEENDFDINVVKMSLTDISKVAFVLNEKSKKSTGLPLRIELCYVLPSGEPQILDVIWKHDSLKN